VIATGVPIPAAPSRNAPNENAINIVYNFLSEVTKAMKLLIISNWPLTTVTLYKNTAPIIIQQMGNNPYSTPWNVDKRASFKGIPYITIANKIATRTVNKLAKYPFIFFIINAQKINNTGIAATIADKVRLFNGSIT
jgi:hypothetical protein